MNKKVFLCLIPFLLTGCSDGYSKCSYVRVGEKTYSSSVLTFRKVAKYKTTTTFLLNGVETDTLYLYVSSDMPSPPVFNKTITLKLINTNYVESSYTAKKQHDVGIFSSGVTVYYSRSKHQIKIVTAMDKKESGRYVSEIKNETVAAFSSNGCSILKSPAWEYKPDESITYVEVGDESVTYKAYDKNQYANNPF